MEKKFQMPICALENLRRRSPGIILGKEIYDTVDLSPLPSRLKCYILTIIVNVGVSGPGCQNSAVLSAERTIDRIIEIISQYAEAA